MGRTNHAEVDQSGRMEMSGETILAVANGFAVTVRITAEVKGVVREVLIRRGVKARMIMIRMFVGAIILAVQDHLSEFDMLTIDEEYIGYETEVRSLLLDRLRSKGHELDKNMITIERVARNPLRIMRQFELHGDKPRRARHRQRPNCWKFVETKKVGCSLAASQACHHPGGIQGIRSSPPDLTVL